MNSDVVFRALADPSRRLLLDMLHTRSGQTLAQLCEGLDMRRQSVRQHLELLETAGLVTAVRDGRRRLHYLNAVPLHEIQSRWIWKFEESRLDALMMIRQRAEEQTVASPSLPEIPDYVYTTYVHATPERVWATLTDPELTGRFWGHSQISAWTVGSSVDHVRSDGSGVSDARGTVLEVDPPRRLAFTFGDPSVADDPNDDPSVVAFDIECHRDIVRLTVTQTRLPSMDARRAIDQGWPSVFANLKTLLETGDVLPQAPWSFQVGADNRAAPTATM